MATVADELKVEAHSIVGFRQELLHIIISKMKYEDLSSYDVEVNYAADYLCYGMCVIILTNTVIYLVLAVNCRRLSVYGLPERESASMIICWKFVITICYKLLVAI